MVDFEGLESGLQRYLGMTEIEQPGSHRHPAAVEVLNLLPLQEPGLGPDFRTEGGNCCEMCDFNLSGAGHSDIVVTSLNLGLHRTDPDLNLALHEDGVLLMPMLVLAHFVSRA